MASIEQVRTSVDGILQEAVEAGAVPNVAAPRRPSSSTWRVAGRIGAAASRPTPASLANAEAIT